MENTTPSHDELQPLACSTGLDHEDRRQARRLTQHLGILKAHARSTAMLLTEAPHLHPDHVAARKTLTECAKAVSVMAAHLPPGGAA